MAGEMCAKPNNVSKVRHFSKATTMIIGFNISYVNILPKRHESYTLLIPKNSKCNYIFEKGSYKPMYYHCKHTSHFG